ncbi:3-isopropylmalate dehydratase large subunit [Albimonas sp. CAU 1670]|uniref:3-isopropylmalate dehydratase large subunit n=1 Tax=Albimonas sp. CAU 1670 TaxID=3032599 RepID=UPI0023D9ED4F|nr:3-isopropylmalate dehydratase large subunit [Albimonas sp. CAU 1670]MDF2231238.1 3-isopropylmalate dehydratase large subunit [Albimonas sp. CAU 1670]
MTAPRTLLDRIWDSHAVVERDDGYTLLYIDRHLMHDGSGGCFAKLHEKGLPLRRPDRSFGTPDHFVASAGGAAAALVEPLRRRALSQMTANADRHGFTLFDLGDPRQGIAHVVGPEQGVTQPGLTMVCGDSHTSTHGALGALAFGVGQSEVAHVMATQCLWQRRPKAMRVTFDGRAADGVTAKDLALAMIAAIGAGGGAGHVIEYAGQAVRELSIEGRLTLCNMSIEAGARAGMVAPDETTFAYLRGRPFAPQGDDWDLAEAHWRGLASDPDAVFDREARIDAASLPPMVTWGVSPEDASPVDGRVPDPAAAPTAAAREGMARTLDYMGLTPGAPIEGIEVDRVFIGSCTNSRIEDLREAARVVRGRKAARPAWVVPGSGLVKAQAEAEGLDVVFRDAGFEWREPGCSMCVGMNGDVGRPGERVASTTNRNFQGRQGPGVRTHLVSPAMAAAAAVEGRFADVRRMLG